MVKRSETALVRDDGDIEGMVTFFLLEKHKAVAEANFLASKGIEPNSAEMDTIHDTARVNLDTLRLRARQIAKAAHCERPFSWRDWWSGVAGNLVATVLTVVLTVLLWISISLPGFKDFLKSIFG